jgi:hypothetical protein
MEREKREELGTRRPLNLDFMIHECSKTNGDTGKPEVRPKEFLVQPNNTQIKEQQLESSNQAVAVATQIFPYSVKLSTNTKGVVGIDIHTYNSDAQAAKNEAIRLFIETREELKDKGIKVLD